MENRASTRRTQRRGRALRATYPYQGYQPRYSNLNAAARSNLDTNLVKFNIRTGPMGASANERRDAANPWPSVYDTYMTRLPLTHRTFITPCFIVICGNFASIINRLLMSRNEKDPLVGTINRARARGKKERKKEKEEEDKKERKERKVVSSGSIVCVKR